MSETRIKSEILRDMLTRTQNGSAQDKRQSLAAEIIGTPPYKIVNVTEDALESACVGLINKCYEFVIQHAPAFETEAEKRRFREMKQIGFQELIKAFLKQLKAKQVNLEKFIYHELYKLDADLFVEGWIRPDNCEGIDFTNPRKAHRLVSDVETSERKLLETLEKIRDTRIELERAKLEQAELRNTNLGLQKLQTSESDLLKIYNELTK